MRHRRRCPLIALITLIAWLAASGPGTRSSADTTPSGGGVGLGSPGRSASAAHALTVALARGTRQAGSASGAEVVDETTGQTLYANAADVPRLPASVEKLYTTTTALLRFGDAGRLLTTLLGVGDRRGASFDGTLYLRGGGDPSFGSAVFDHRAYGTGSTPGELARALQRAGVRRVRGAIVADGSALGASPGTPPTGGRASIDLEGVLGGLTYDRGWLDASGTLYAADPARQAGSALAAALRGAGIATGPRVQVSTGRTPSDAIPIAVVASPPMATLVRLTNAPSDNFFAEILLRDLGSQFGAGGSTAAGAAVVRAEIEARFGLHPQLDDGSGLSRYDRTTPAQVVSLLGAMARDSAFTHSLAVTGRTGTLRLRNRRSYAAGRCEGKTGTLHDVSNLVGYCRARDGDRLAYAFLMNRVVPDAAHPIQDAMQLAVARYDG